MTVLRWCVTPDTQAKPIVLGAVIGTVASGAQHHWRFLTETGNDIGASTCEVTLIISSAKWDYRFQVRIKIGAFKCEARVAISSAKKEMLFEVRNKIGTIKLETRLVKIKNGAF